MESFFNKSVEESLKALNTDPKKGLSAQEVVERTAKYGENKLEGKKEKSLLMMFLEQFKDFLVIILIIAAVISIYLGEYIDGSIILLIVLLNAILGVSQENKASNALKALKELASPNSKVLRDGSVMTVTSSAIVPGDIIILDAGDYVPADLRLIETINLKIDESALTGESVPSEKDASKILPDDAGVGDKINSGFMGTIVTYGRGRGMVERIGMKTEMGKIATMLTDTVEEETPLQKKLNNLGKVLGIVCLVVCALIFGLGILYGKDMFRMFMDAVALAVAAIPEGLTVVVTVILALGMQKMVKSHAIVKKLSAVETLGSTTVICSDKTGTLTQNKMTVVSIFDGKNTYDITGTGYGSDGSILDSQGNAAKTKSLSMLLEGAVLCNDAVYKQEEAKIIGDPTEGSLLVVAEKYGIHDEELKTKYPRINEIPFDSGRKLMSTFQDIDGKITMFTKGAPDEVLRRSSFYYDNGEIIELTDNQKEIILKQNYDYGSNALRVLGVAFRLMDKIESVDSDREENNLIFVGLLGMIDPPREEVKPAIETCKRAGIQVKMITGDHKVTAGAIGKEIGIVPCDNAIEGREIGNMSDEELREAVKHTSIFARVSPEHKVRLVEAVRANGNIVAMTGDGVNDAPSLKRADIGIAMGITGTDVSKEAADMILTDDNFASIVKAVEEGRVIYENIRKVVAYLLSCNLGEILLIFVAMIFNLPTPLVAIQLLSINLITDAFPAFALGMEEKEEGIMEQKPRDPSEPIVNRKMMVSVAIQSIALALGSLCSFLVGLYVFRADTILATTMCFVTIVLGELLRAYSARSEHKPIVSMKIFGNSFLNKSVLCSIAFLIIVVYVPFLNNIFNTTALGVVELIAAILFAFIPMVGGELSKKFVSKM